MPDNASIFLSYSSDDVEFALPFAGELRNAGLQVFVDRDNIPPGVEWPPVLKDALDAASALIAVITPKSLKSKHCNREWHRADDMGIPIYPILVEPIEDTDRPLMLQSRQYVDFVNWRDPGSFSSQFHRLTAAIQGRCATIVTSSRDAEVEYLNNLIAQTERQSGVLQYEPLGLSSGAPPSIMDDEWGFSFLSNPHQQRPSNSEAEVVGLTEILAIHSTFVLAGQPGAGKSTVLRRLAHDAAQKRLVNTAEPVPLIVSLPEWGDDSDFTSFLQRQLRQRRCPVSPTGRYDTLWILLDGLNELGKKGPTVAGALRHWLKSQGPTARIIVACRQADYASLDLEIPVVLIRELSTAQIASFARNYLGNAADAFLARVHWNTNSKREGLSRIHTFFRQ